MTILGKKYKAFEDMNYVINDIDMEDKNIMLKEDSFRQNRNIYILQQILSLGGCWVVEGIKESMNNQKMNQEANTTSECTDTLKGNKLTHEENQMINSTLGFNNSDSAASDDKCGGNVTYTYVDSILFDSIISGHVSSMRLLLQYFSTADAVPGNKQINIKGINDFVSVYKS